MPARFPGAGHSPAGCRCLQVTGASRGGRQLRQRRVRVLTHSLRHRQYNYITSFLQTTLRTVVTAAALPSETIKTWAWIILWSLGVLPTTPRNQHCSASVVSTFTSPC